MSPNDPRTTDPDPDPDPAPAPGPAPARTPDPAPARTPGPAPARSSETDSEQSPPAGPASGRRKRRRVVRLGTETAHVAGLSADERGEGWSDNHGSRGDDSHLLRDLPPHWGGAGYRD